MNTVLGTVNELGGQFLNFAWPMLWQSSLLIALMFALDFLLAKKIRAAVRYALWLVVLAKLLLPPTLALPTGAAWWLGRTKSVFAAPAAKHFTVAYGPTLPPMDFASETIPPPLPAPPKLDPAGGLLLAAGAVSAGLLLWLAIRWWQVTRKVRQATGAEKFAGVFADARQLAGLRSGARLKLVDGRLSPAVCGLFCPVILLPRALAEKLSPAQLRAVLLHELFHLRRRDVWVNCAQALLQIFYWWHPLLWFANARFRRLREEAVDDAVMLALRTDADSYAPTLLAVARLAFYRPLMSLGLVGIMESRSALRRRIERLVNFRAPRRAGLTFASLCGILAFSAVALPMGEGPAPAEKQFASGDGAAAEENSLTVKVDPEIFIRNVKAQVAKTLLPQTDSYMEILLDLLRSEGVDCQPPHGLAFNHVTGEITTQNTPDKLEVFRRVIGQLNRADGICELPLRNPPLQRKRVLIEAHIYPVSAGQFEKFTAGLRRYSGGVGDDPWWSVPPGKVQQLIGDIEASGLQAVTRPRVLTSSGIPAIFYLGDGTNGTELACKPFAEDGFIDLTLHGTIVSGAPANAATNQVFSRASAEDHGGIVLRVENSDGHDEKDFVTVISVEIVTNGPTHFQQRLVPLGKPASVTPPGQAQELVQAGKLLYEIGKLDEAEQKLQNALALDPENASAKYYLDLVQAGRRNAGVIQTGTGRQEILRQLETIRLENFSTGDRGLPLNDVLKQLAEQSKLRDPGRKGINFLINNNAALSGQPVAAPTTTGAGGPRLDFDIGVPGAPTAQTAATTNEPVDVGSLIIKLPSLTQVRLADLLDAIVLVADHPIKYSIQDFAIVFSAKGPETPQLFMRTFRVDPGTFYRGLENVRTQGVRSVSKSGSGGGMEIGDGPDWHPGSPVYITTKTSASTPSALAKAFFTDLGVNLQEPPGKSVFFNDRLGYLFVKATESDLDTIERALQVVNQATPQLHIKVRFLEVKRGDSRGFDWYLGQLSAAGAAASNQSSPNNVPASKGNPGKLVGILTDSKFKTIWRALNERKDVEVLGEPEATTTSGRQTQMRATGIVNVVTNLALGQTRDAHGALVMSDTLVPQTKAVETGPVLEVVPYVLADGYTINLALIPSLKEFLGYDGSTNLPADKKIDPSEVKPKFLTRQMVSTVNLWDGQTALLGGFTEKDTVNGLETADKAGQADKDLLVFVTATIVDPAGNRVHADDDLPFAREAVPPQPSQPK